MPTILPVDDAVSWPTNEGVIGVVGVAPWATLDFLKALYKQINASKDWHYPRVLCDINTKLPSRGRHLELGERDPSPFIAATIVELAHQGATLVVVPCNTAHILYDRWTRDAPVPIPHIVNATIDILRVGGAKKAAIFGSNSLHRHGLYERALEAASIGVTSLHARDQDLVNLAIGEVKTNAHVSPALFSRLDDLMRRLASQGTDGLVLGCTELAALEAPAKSHLHVVAESNKALAAAALRGIR